MSEPESAASVSSKPVPKTVARAATEISAKRQIAGLPTGIFAQLGVLALVVGFGGYLWHHIFVLAYLVAFYAYVIADILIRPPLDREANRDTFQTKWGQLLLMISYAAFAAAPFERTYFYSIEAPAWLGAFAISIQLIGFAIALVARVQLGNFGTPHLAVQEKQHVITGGLYNRVRHPLYAGLLLSYLAWPIVYGAPVAVVAIAVYRFLMFRRRMNVEEEMMRERFGLEYEAYARATRRLIPGVY